MPTLSQSIIVVGGLEVITLDVKEWLMAVLKQEFDEFAGVGTESAGKAPNLPIVEVSGSFLTSDAHFPAISVHRGDTNTQQQFLADIVRPAGTGDGEDEALGETFSEQLAVNVASLKSPERDVLRRCLEAVLFVRLRELKEIGIEKVTVSGGMDHQVTTPKPTTYYGTDYTITLDNPHVYIPANLKPEDRARRLTQIVVHEHFVEE
jgi:hypothetical protein